MRWLVLILGFVLFAAALWFGESFLGLPMAARLSIAGAGVVGLSALTWWAGR